MIRLLGGVTTAASLPAMKAVQKQAGSPLGTSGTMNRLSLAAVLLLASGLAAEERFPFPPHPRLATTATELAKLKESAARKTQAIREAEGLLKAPPRIPDGWGNWAFYYACPDDGSDLVALDEKKHQCPRCKQILTDERTVASYRTLLHDRANRAALRLAWAYALTGENSYASGVHRILMKYADAYPRYPARADRWGRTGWLAQLGGRRYSQSLDEAVGVIQLAKAYDLTRSAPVWDDKQRQHVEKSFFRLTADTLLYANLDINNHQTWFNAGLMAIASVLGDKPLLDKVLSMRGGFHDQLKRSMGDDGLWYEGTMAYHNYALQAMIEIVDAGRKLGLPLHKEPRFRKLILAPLTCAYPNGQFPAINDSDQAYVSNFRASFLWAWNTYREPVFAQAYAGGNLKLLRELLGPDATVQPYLETRSLNLADAGLAILRRGSGANAVCVMADHGPHGGSHGHYDKLNVVLFANGREWLLDPGRLSYSHKEYRTWVKQTAAHNTVTLGGRSQSATTGKLLWLRSEKGYDACAIESAGAYPGSRLGRRLLLADQFLVDVFDVRADQETQIDLFAHALSEKLNPISELGTGTAVVPGKDDGYQHLTGGIRWEVKGPTQWEFVSGKQKLRLWQDGPTRESLIACTGIGYTIDAKVPCLIRRVQAKEARFVTVYDLSGNGSFITGLRREGKADWVVRTRLGDRKIRLNEAGVSLE